MTISPPNKQETPRTDAFRNVIHVRAGPYSTADWMRLLKSHDQLERELAAMQSRAEAAESDWQSAEAECAELSEKLQEVSSARGDSALADKLRVAYKLYCGFLELSEAIKAIARHGFDKDVTKDGEAQMLWLELNRCQKQADQLLTGYQYVVGAKPSYVNCLSPKEHK